MKSVGETMAIGRNFKESLQKAFRSLEIGVDGLDLKAEKKLMLKIRRLFKYNMYRTNNSY